MSNRKLSIERKLSDADEKSIETIRLLQKCLNRLKKFRQIKAPRILIEREMNLIKNLKTIIGACFYRECMLLEMHDEIERKEKHQHKIERKENKTVKLRIVKN